MKKKIILDTDIGSDIDDAITLTYLLCHPDCELLGVTTMTGEVVKRAMVADSIIKHFGRDIPVYPGVSNPILGPQRQPNCRQAEMLERWPHAKEYRPNYAIEFIREMVEKYPGEVTLLTVGPATNAGLLLATYPHVAEGLREVVQMMGYFTNNLGTGITSEWNCLCDPVAAAIVYQAKLRRHLSIGLDVTMKTVLPEDVVNRRFTVPALRPVYEYSIPWFKFKVRQGMIFHDPLAAACIFDDKFCTYKRGTVSVDLISNDAEFARTNFVEKVDGAHEIAIAVNADRYFEHFFAIVDAGM